MTRTARFAIAVGLIVAALFPAQAAFAKKAKIGGAPIQLVLGACDRTAGCDYKLNNGGTIIGCSKNACFVCSGKTCTGVNTHARTAGDADRPPKLQMQGQKIKTAFNSQKVAPLKVKPSAVKLTLAVH